MKDRARQSPVGQSEGRRHNEARAIAFVSDLRQSRRSLTALYLGHYSLSHHLKRRSNDLPALHRTPVQAAAQGKRERLNGDFRSVKRFSQQIIAAAAAHEFARVGIVQTGHK